MFRNRGEEEQISGRLVVCYIEGRRGGNRVEEGVEERWVDGKMLPVEVCEYETEENKVC